MNRNKRERLTEKCTTYLMCLSISHPTAKQVPPGPIPPPPENKLNKSSGEIPIHEHPDLLRSVVRSVKKCSFIGIGQTLKGARQLESESRGEGC